MPSGPKLRAEPLATPFHVVLVEPEIPPNTGAVARTCAATGSILHLVEPLGFRIDAQSVRRAGLDYWPLVDLRRHADWPSYRASVTGRHHFLTSGAPQSLFDRPIQLGDTFVFGKESSGLDRELLERHAADGCAIPTLGPVRSLNLSNAVAITVFFALRAVGAFEHPSLEEARVP